MGNKLYIYKINSLEHQTKNRHPEDLKLHHLLKWAQRCGEIDEMSMDDPMKIVHL